MADVPPPAGPASPKGAMLKQARFALLLLIVINLFNYIDRYNLTAVESNIRAEFLKDDPDAMKKSGNLALAFMASYMVIAPLFGWLGDRMNRWHLIALGIAGWTLATGASGWAVGYWSLFAARCFVGIGEAAYVPSAAAIIADYYPLKTRGKAIAWFYAAIPVGSAIGVAMGGVIAEWLGWRWVFFAMVPPGLLLAGWCLFMPEPPRGQSEAAGAGFNVKPSLQNYLLILSNRSYLFSTLGMTAMTFAIGGVTYWMPTYVFEVGYGKQMSQGLVTTIFGGIVVLAGLGSTLFGGWLADRCRNRGVKGAYFTVSGVGMLIGFVFFVATLFTPFPYAWGMLFLAIFFLFMNTGPTNTILANVIHPAMRPMSVAINIFIIHAFGDAVSPLIIGAIADWTAAKENLPPSAGLQQGFLFVSGFILLSGLLWCWGARYLDRDTENAPFMLGDDSPPPTG